MPLDLNTVAEIVHPTPAWPAWRHGDAFLGGGTWLFSEPQPGLRRLIDLDALTWDSLDAGPAGLSIGATCRFASLAEFAAPPEWQAAALLRQCCEALLGSFKIWNMATVGGNLCLGLPAGPMVALATALDGVCTLAAADGTSRLVPAEAFVTGPQRTVLRPGEALRRIDLPLAALRRRSTFRRVSLTPLGRSAALLIGTADPAGAFALTVTAATPRPVRLDFPAVPSAAALQAALDAAIPAYYDDVHGHQAWRRHMTGRLAAEIRADLA